MGRHGCADGGHGEAEECLARKLPRKRVLKSRDLVGR